MGFKRTCNAADVARMTKLAEAGNSVKQIVNAMRIDETCVRRNLVGVTVRIETAEDHITEVVGGEMASDPAPAVTQADPAPAPVNCAPPVDARSPQQKAADTRKANKEAADSAADGPGFLE